MQKTCPQCSSRFEAPPSGRKYCCKGCYYESERLYGPQTKRCPTCKKKFVVDGGHRDRKYCSFPCSIKDRKRQNWHRYDRRLCPQCRKKFKVISWSHKRFCSPRCSSLFRRGKPNGQRLPRNKLQTMRKVRTRTVNGRVIFVHRLVMEQHLGRKLKARERVHHIDVDGENNALRNLYLCANEREHGLAHRSMDALIKPLLEARIIRFKAGRYIMRRSQ